MTRKYTNRRYLHAIDKKVLVFNDKQLMKKDDL